ncbi:MAG: protein phosphatase [Humibacillus sp.]|nr:protein phosphatase [Humibacillus sp.]MDN5779385.1 protein phosphatase [Humibacillus sp.]
MDGESGWGTDQAGILVLPSGRRLRGRGLGRPTPPGARPQFGLYLLGPRPPALDWPARWLRWRDFRLPVDPVDAGDAFEEAWGRAASERVEVACRGGIGRTGTALACIAIIDGVPAADAVAFVREHYHPRAVETPSQERFVAHFPT